MAEDWITDDEPLELTAPPMSFVELVWSDYLAAHEGTQRDLRALVLFLPRLLLNPSLQLAFLVRVAQKGPPLVWYPVRLLQVWFFSSEIYVFRGPGAIELGPGVRFPHPVNIILGPGDRIGADVTIYNATNIGGDRHYRPGQPVDRSPWIGDRAVIYAYSSVQGPWRVGQDATVGSYVVLDEHVPPGALKTRNRLRLRGEWPGEPHRDTSRVSR